MFKTDGSINLNYNSNKKPGLIAQIFEDNWFSLPDNIKNSILKYKPNFSKEISKIIDCHNKNLGCSVYECPDCGDITFLGHTCESRFCSSCGYKYKLERVENIMSTAYNCKHRQIVFTCAKELWPFFFVDFENMMNLYFSAVNKTINSILNESFKFKDGKTVKYTSKIKYTPGFFAFLHTFGRDLKWNLHIHILIAELKLCDGKNVAFCYNSHVDNSYHEVTVTASQFITIILRHLLPNNFKIIRYYGFYRKNIAFMIK